MDRYDQDDVRGEGEVRQAQKEDERDKHEVQVLRPSRGASPRRERSVDPLHGDHHLVDVERISVAGRYVITPTLSIGAGAAEDLCEFRSSSRR